MQRASRGNGPPWIGLGRQTQLYVLTGLCPMFSRGSAAGTGHAAGSHTSFPIRGGHALFLSPRQEVSSRNDTPFLLPLGPNLSSTTSSCWRQITSVLCAVFSPSTKYGQPWDLPRGGNLALCSWYQNSKYVRQKVRKFMSRSGCLLAFHILT